mgnify:CR=1 FL=1
MSQEKPKEKKLASDINALLVRNEAEPHEIPVGDEECLRIWVKPITFLQTQRAIKEVVNLNATSGEVAIDLEGYWKHMLMTCVERVEPEMSKAQMLALRPEIMQHITALLPQPQDLMTGPLVDGGGTSSE